MADLDHTTVQAPYLRLNETYPTPNGDVVALWDFRLTQPNQARVDPHARHSTEHAVICALRQFHPSVFLAAPMGCGTGLYVTAINVTDYDEMEANLAGALTWLGKQTAVPWADEFHCGCTAITIWPAPRNSRRPCSPGARSGATQARTPASSPPSTARTMRGAEYLMILPLILAGR